MNEEKMARKGEMIKNKNLDEIVEKGDLGDLRKKLKELEEFDKDLLKHMIEISPNRECADMIIGVYNDKRCQKEGIENRAGEEMGNGRKEVGGANKRGVANGATSKNTDIERHLTGNTKIDKGAKMLLESFKSNIKEVNEGKCFEICVKIAKLTHEEYPSTFPKMIRTKTHNLKENKELCVEVYEGRRDLEDVVKMTTEDMKSEKLRSRDEESIKNGLLDAQIATRAAETEMFKCSKCNQRKCTYSQLQTRSCDEPMTTFVHCTVCGNRWKF